MIKKLSFWIFGFILAVSFALAADSFTTNTNNAQFSNPSLNNYRGYYSSSDIATYWPALSESIKNGQCEGGGGTDFLVMIPPLGCSPSVVRSDLLEEQNVPVFCKLAAAQVNPLIDVNAIKSISYKGKYPDNVASVSYHPAQIATNDRNSLTLNNPVVNNIGYVVIVLKRQSNESAMPEWVTGNLTATINYNAEKAFGVGQAEFYLRSMDETTWENNYAENSFWNGKGYLRLVDVDGENARIALYTDEGHVFREITLKEGKTSEKIYFPGFYCQAGLKIKLNGIVSDKGSALLNIDGTNVWVREGTKFLGGACTVSKLDIAYGGSGSVSFSCKGKTIKLSLLNKNVANINDVSYELGQKVKENESASYYLGYVGSTKKGLFSGTDNSKLEIGTGFAVLISSPRQSLAVDNSRLTALSSSIAKIFKNSDEGTMTISAFEAEVKKAAGGDVIILYNVDGKRVAADGSLTLGKIVEREASASLDDINQNLVDNYFKETDNTLGNLLDLYPTEKEGITTFGEQAIFDELTLIDIMAGKGMDNPSRRTELVEQFLRLYPSSSLRVEVMRIAERGGELDVSNSFANVYANNQYRQISLVQFREVDKSTKSAEFYVAGAQSVHKTVHEGEVVWTAKENEGNYFVITSIERNVIQVAHYKYDKSKPVYQRTVSLKEGVSQEINRVGNNAKGEYTLSVNSISVLEVASVSLIPEVATSSMANFTYKIGIEKRAIELSPEKANETAQKLNETIKKWEENNAKLGKLIEGWKGACLITSGVLQIKTLIGGFTGASTARQNVMGLYKSKCQTNATYKDMNSAECYAKESSYINNDVEIYKKAIEKVNGDIRGKSTDAWKSANPGKSIPTAGIVAINTSDLNSWDEIRAYLLNEYISTSLASNELKNKTKKELETRMQFVAARKKIFIDNALATAADTGKYSDGSAPKYGSIEDENAKVTNNFWTGQRAGEVVRKIDGESLTVTLNKLGNSGISDRTPVQFLPFNGKSYLLILNEGEPKRVVLPMYVVNPGDGNYIEFKKPENAQIDPVVYNDYNTLSRAQFQMGSTGKCNNPYKTNVFSVEFYESGSYKGYPAKVPFDPKNGWYVRASSSTGAISDSTKNSYKESGEVSYFSIYNVGEDGAEGNDDLYTGIDFNSNLEGIKNIAGCQVSAKERESLINDAKEALRIAKKNTGSKSFRYNINGRGWIEVQGKEAVADLGYECEDFMSPEDCNKLYNVCDPVICPPSRCNFGGEFKVANVIQSGIVGSILLCLPNAGFPSNGGVIVPICLTGIHAGIEGYISILKSEQACLLDAAKTGKHTGICDEITSIYKCEFFWKQVSPMIQSLVPKLAELAYNSARGIPNQKGGGEYLTFQQSWDNMQNSVDYFKNTYASTSFRAFKFGNVEEIGTSFCQNFIGTSVPSSAEALDSLLAPESPTQFYAQFSEIVLTEATVPATSQYKVYYHIYAGKDEGVRYQVYLKDPPSTSYVYNSQTIAVPGASGYITVGEQVDVAKDFSAPAGYKQLCVMINNQEECGFKQVTTDFGIDALHDSYAKQQAAAKDVKTEKECVQGSSSVVSLANVNLQAGVEETISPNIALRGIVRVCSNENPGAGTNADNWIDVGYCGDVKVKCWLDNSSLNEGALNVLKNSGTASEAKTAIENIDGSVSYEGSEDKLKEIKSDIKIVVDFGTEASLTQEKKIDIQKLASKIDNLTLNTNKQKANLVYLKFGLYNDVIKFIIGLKSASAPAPPAAETPKASDAVNEQASITEKYSVGLENVLMKEGGYIYSTDGKSYFYLKKVNEKYMIMKAVKVTQDDVNAIGEISSSGEISLYKVISPEDMALLQDLENYKFESVNMKFVKKESSAVTNTVVSSSSATAEDTTTDGDVPAEPGAEADNIVIPSTPQRVTCPIKSVSLSSNGRIKVGETFSVVIYLDGDSCPSVDRAGVFVKNSADLIDSKVFSVSSASKTSSNIIASPNLVMNIEGTYYVVVALYDSSNNILAVSQDSPGVDLKVVSESSSSVSEESSGAEELKSFSDRYSVSSNVVGGKRNLEINNAPSSYSISTAVKDNAVTLYYYSGGFDTIGSIATKETECEPSVLINKDSKFKDQFIAESNELSWTYYSPADNQFIVSNNCKYSVGSDNYLSKDGEKTKYFLQKELFSFLFRSVNIVTNINGAGEEIKVVNCGHINSDGTVALSDDSNCFSLKDIKNQMYVSNDKKFARIKVDSVPWGIF